MPTKNMGNRVWCGTVSNAIPPLFSLHLKRYLNDVHLYSPRSQTWDRRYRVSDAPGGYGATFAVLSDGRKEVMLSAFGHAKSKR